MNELKSILNGSKTFAGFEFCGSYTMPTDVFFKIYDYWIKENVNFLDSYSQLTYMLWESSEDSVKLYTYEEVDNFEEILSTARRLQLFDVDSIHTIRYYLRKCWRDYRDYLDRKRNETRRNACKFTAMPEVRNYVFTKYGRECLCCGSAEKIALDHVVPITKGGADDVGNLQPLCRSCNSKKGTKIIDYR